MKPKLIAEAGQAKGLVFHLENDQNDQKDQNEWFLGRDPDLCNLSIEDPKVSRQHALLTQSDEGILIENLSLTNPILINDILLSAPTRLNEGDHLKIGGTTFLYTTKEVEELPLPSLEVEEEGGVDAPYATIFEDIPEEDIEEAEIVPPLDLTIRERWLLKIVTGPQMGAEFSMIPGRSYVIGSDAATSDIILYDLSVSKRHARITVGNDENCLIEDLESKNGIFVDGKQIKEQISVPSGKVVSLGTTSFVIIDRESASQTIISTSPQEKREEPVHAAVAPDIVLPQAEVVTRKHLLQRLISSRESFVIFLVLVALALLLGFGLSTLFTGEEETIPETNINKEITTALEPFPEVTYSYNKSTGMLFLVGHVPNPVDKSQLEYNLKGLTAIAKVDDTNVVVDQYIWQEMNNLLARNPNWAGISMHSSKPGVFVITGYLKTRAEFANLTDYLNLNFNYLDLLQNKVAVEEDILGRINSDLLAQGLNGVTVQVNNGDVTLSGFISSAKQDTLLSLITSWKSINGVRAIRNFVAALAPQEAVINLSDRYQVTGFSTHDHTNINVVINGRILTRGDTIDGMTITSIQSNNIFLEKDGLKFKIEYNA